MTDGPLSTLGVDDLLTAYQQGSTNPLAVCEALVCRLDLLEPSLNSLACRDPDLLSAAETSARRWATGETIGELDGVPLIIKDNLKLAGLPASWGNAELATRSVMEDELPIARLRSAGALFIGKANTPEFAVEGYTASDHFGVTRNPFDSDLTPGGSSGGVAAAVAAGLAPAGIGTDGGGSIRRPAGYCGLSGLKPGIGHVPRSGGLPQVLLDFEVVGPMARSVVDLQRLDRVLAGADRKDPSSRGTVDPAVTAAPRVLYVPHIGDAPCDPAIVQAADAFAGELAHLGCRVETGTLPLNIDELTERWSCMAEIGLARLFDTDPAVAESAPARYRAMAERGRRQPATALYALLQTIAELRAAASVMFEEWDLILTPASAAMPWLAVEPFPEVINHRPVGPRGHAVYSGWVNAIGHPALALPASVPAASLPVGVQLVGDLGSEASLLAFGVHIERSAQSLELGL